MPIRRRPFGALLLPWMVVSCASSPPPAPEPRVQAEPYSATSAEAPSSAASVPPPEQPPEAPPTQIEDEVEDAVGLAPRGEPLPHPLDDVSPEELQRLVLEDPELVGSMSIGNPSSGRLINGVRMPEGPYWEIVDPEHAWGTQETVDYLVDAIKAVRQRYPESPMLSIGHISAENGGHLTPHLSHQSGRDVDISYYYKSEGKWYKRANAGNLDLDRTWAFVKALITRTDVDMILIDYSIQRLLRTHAESIGDDAAWLDSVFRGGPGLRPIIRHARGHASHMHIRFFNPIAQETARRAVPILVEHGLLEGPTHYVTHRVRKGETLSRLASRYGTTVKAIQRANGLRSTLIQAKKSYKIPQKGLPRAAAKPTSIPPRRLPPGRDDH